MFVIFGNSGFIGSNLQQKLSRRNGPGSGKVLGFGSKDCDLTDAGAVEKAFAQLPSTTKVVVCSTINRKIDNSFVALQKNLAMAENLSNAVAKHPISSLIYLSSVDVYGTTPPHGITEATRVDPVSYYAIGKLAGEHLIRHAGGAACPITILRCPGVFGPFDQLNSIIGLFASRIMAGDEITLFGDGQVFRDYLDVDTGCEVICNLLDRPYQGVLNIARGESLSMNQWIALLEDACGRRANLLRGDNDANAAGDLVFDISALSQQMGNEGYTDPKAAIRAYVTYLSTPH